MSQLSTSFIQNSRHVSKSDKFVVIQPSQIATVLADHGFDMVGLKTGRPKDPSRADYQTTIARYRSNSQFAINGLSLDIMFKVPHLYGALEARLGFFRGTCANQWNMGQLFECLKVRHIGDALDEINNLIPRLVAQQASLIETIKLMQARNVTPEELSQLATDVAQARVAGIDNVTEIKTVDLLKPRRQDDTAQDLFTVVNVLQENATRFGIRYQTKTFNPETNVVSIRDYTSRRINEASVKAIELNASIWDIATKLVQAA